jgi:DNA repair protein RadC
MKPGRKLVERGPEGCTDADLLAILVGSGGRGYSAEDVARGLLERYGTLASLMGRPLREVAGVRGIGAVKAIRLAAAYELARRIVADLERNG